MYHEDWYCNMIYDADMQDMVVSERQMMLPLVYIFVLTGYRHKQTMYNLN
jgi:hypothetical protein